MEQIISVLKYLATSNAINFIIMLVLLGFVIKKINLGQSFANSVEQIKSSIDKSYKERMSAVRKLEQSEALIEKLPSDVSDLESNAKNKIQVFKAQIEDRTQKSIYDIEKNIDRVLELEEAKISNLLTEKTSIDSIEVAKTQIIDMLNHNPELHNQFIHNSLKELDEVKL